MSKTTGNALRLANQVELNKKKNGHAECCSLRFQLKPPLLSMDLPSTDLVYHEQSRSGKCKHDILSRFSESINKAGGARYLPS